MSLLLKRWPYALKFEKMDAAFCAAMLRAIDAGNERAPEAICKEPGTRNPIFVLAN
jgi:hypothetical protein